MKAATEHIVRLKNPHAKQREFLDSPAKRKIVRAGRRSGKTTAAGILAVQRFLAGHRVLYAVPVSDQLEHFWREVKAALAELLDARVLVKNETEHFIERPGTNQRIRAKTAWNADTLRGDYADLLILDEFQLMDETAWSEVGAPMLLDNDGDALFIYTPPSRQSRSVSKARDPRHAAKMFKVAEADKSGRWAAFHFTSHDNPHISADALSEISADMTQLAIRQEILAEDVEEIAGALWKQALIDETRVTEAPEFVRVVVAVDPSGSSRSTADECGIIVAGLGADGHGYVLKDASLRSTPQAWAAAAVATYHAHEADRLIAEQNFGAEMVEAVIRTVDEEVSYRAVNASRGKIVRAEPVSALYEKRRVHHVGVFDKLEDELCSYVPGGASPNRLDALVWALTELMLASSWGWAASAAHRWLEAGKPEICTETAFLDPRELNREAAQPAATEAAQSPDELAREVGTAQKAAYGLKTFGEIKRDWGPPGKTVNPARTAQAGLCPQCAAPLSVYQTNRKCNSCGYVDQDEATALVRRL